MLAKSRKKVQLALVGLALTAIVLGAYYNVNVKGRKHILFHYREERESSWRGNSVCIPLDVVREG